MPYASTNTTSTNYSDISIVFIWERKEREGEKKNNFILWIPDRFPFWGFISLFLSLSLSPSDVKFNNN